MSTAVFVWAICVPVLWTALSLVISRYAWGKFKYSRWLNAYSKTYVDYRRLRHSEACEFEDFSYTDEGLHLTLIVCCTLCLLPFVAAYAFMTSDTWAIAPKHHRAEQQLKEQQEYIAKLERQLEDA